MYLWSLIGASTVEDRGNRQREDSQVTAQRQVLDVLALDGKPLLEPLPAAAEHLHRTRQPRLDHEPDEVLRLVAAHEPHLLRSRSDEAHVRLEDVPEPWQPLAARAPRGA